MVASKPTELYRRDVRKQGRPLTPLEREKLLEPYLPGSPPLSPNRKGSRRSNKKRPVRTFLKTQIHVFVYTIIHTIFSFYIRLRQIYHAVVDRIFALLYYHHRTPELIRRDVRGLSRLPNHLSILLELKEGGAGLEGLVDEVSEISAWCACAGIPTLSIYEKTGILKSYIPQTHRAITSKMHAYFGPQRPSLQLGAPHIPSYLNGDSDSSSPSSRSRSGHLNVLLLCEEDGRATLVDLTKTLTQMSQRHKLVPSDISLELVDAELSESIMGEPDLLISFGPTVVLEGFPPWPLRLTEIFHVQDNTAVGYQVFLRGLHNYAKAQMRFGR